MKKFITVLCLMALLVPGCISASYNPSTREIHYNRVGNMKASGIAVVIDPNGVLKVKVASEENTGLEAVLAALSAAYQAGLKSAAPIVK
jgi:hypothetical protein